MIYIIFLSFVCHEKCFVNTLPAVETDRCFSGFAWSVAQNSTNKVTEIGDGSRSTNIYTLEEIRIAERGRVKKWQEGGRPYGIIY